MDFDALLARLRNLDQTRLNRYLSIGAVVGMALFVAVLEVGEHPHWGLAAVAGGLYLALLLRDPPTALGLFLAATVLFPRHVQLFGRVDFPDASRLIGPGLLLGSGLMRLRHRGTGKLRLLGADLWLMMFVGCSFLTMIVVPGALYWKVFVKTVVYPMLAYYATRWIQLDMQRVIYLLRWLAGALLLLAPIMAIETVTGHNPVYDRRTIMYSGALKDAVGSFGEIWVAGSFLGSVVPLVLFLASAESAAGRRFFWALASLCVPVMAIVSHERAALLTAGTGLVLCSMDRLTRSRAYVALSLLGLLGLGLVATGAAQTIVSRLTESNPYEQRTFYNRAAFNYLSSGDWNPLLGSGFFRWRDIGYKYAPNEVASYSPTGRPFMAAQAIFKRALHNLELTLLIEFGLLGCLAVTGFGLCLLRQIHAIRARLGPPGQAGRALLMATVATILMMFVNGQFHNVYEMPSLATYFWFLAGLLLGHPEIFTGRPWVEGEAGRGSGIPEGGWRSLPAPLQVRSAQVSDNGDGTARPASGLPRPMAPRQAG